jgi:hypothetical protein
VAYRDFVVEYQKTLDDVGTLIKDISVTDPVSAFYLEFEGVNGAISNKGNFLSDVITKIEVTDGATVLYSLSLAQLEALDFYKTYKTPTLFPSEFASGTQRHGVYLYFGQWLWDDQFSMDFTRYKNPQLKITSNANAIRSTGATGFLSGYLKATIIAKIMEGGPRSPNYLMAKEIESFTSASSGEKRIDLPVDYIYRLLMLRAWKQQSDVDEIISDIKLTADSDKFVPVNRKVKQLDAESFCEYGAGRIKHDILTQHQVAFRLMFNKEPSLVVYPWEDASPPIIGIRYTWSSEGKLDLTDNAGTLITTDQNFTCVEEGHALHATLPLVFGQIYAPDTWLNPRSYNKFEAVLTQATASAAVSVVAEQVKPAGQ